MKRILLALAALIVLAAAAVYFWPRSGESIGHTVRYSDGTTLTLREVTYGTEHRYRGGGFRERLISILPAKLRSMFASRRNLLTTPGPTIAFWLERRGTPARTSDLVLCDENGFGVTGDYRMMRLAPPNDAIEGWSYEAWPRRQRLFTLRIYEHGQQYGQAKLIGEFRVRNPTVGKYPEWKAAPLPLSVTNEDLSVTLFDFTAGVGPGSMRTKPAPSPVISQTRAGFRVERNAQPTREWGVVSVEMTDATGNAPADSVSSSSDRGGVEWVGLQSSLWPSESAWKLRVGFSQRSNLVATELWKLDDLPLWTAGTNEITLQTNMQGALVQFTGTDRRMSLSGDYHFNFRITPGRPEYRLTFASGVDDHGNKASLTSSYESSAERTFALNVKTNAKHLNLTVAFHRTRYFEFLARPELVTTNSAVLP